MSPTIQLDGLQTEGRNPNSQDIDQFTTTELCRIINREDASVAAAVEECIPSVAAAIEDLVKRGREGGRVIYVGAGTSGRLGVLDASEIPPTYSASSEQFIALIAGGDAALRYAQEGAEDDVVAAETDLRALNLNGAKDSLVGIAASGRTPYVLSCLSFARSLGCTTIGIACSHPSAMSEGGNVDHMISVITGPEVVTGSTRMKAGTATKLVLNMLSTGVMIKLGKTYGNMMIDLQATNEKLQQRSRNIIRAICGSKGPSSDQELDIILSASGGSVKLAVATILLQTSVPEAKQRLKEADNVLAKVLRDSSKPGIYKSILNGGHVEEYVLCVDGGGSKCAAVVLGKNGEVGRGEAGECNVTSVGFDAAMSSISLAVQRAVDSCKGIQEKPFQSVQFRKIWIGLAGYDRPNIAGKVNSFLSKLFGLPMGEQLKISTDLDLLVTTTANIHHLDSVVVLVAGTGSIAMSYARDGNGFKRTGRAGGWGPLLGDDGSGYGIGRQGLRFALEAVDEFNLRQDGIGSTRVLDPLVQKICEKFGIGSQLDHRDSRVDLLSQVLSKSSDGQTSTSSTRRIAEVARVVLDACSSSDPARAIIEAGSQALVNTLISLTKNQGIKTSNSSLILAGGLLQNDMYQKLVLSHLASTAMKFGYVQPISDPALNAAQYLVHQL